MTARPARQLEALTSLRFFAAAAVVLHHSRGWFGIPADLGQSAFSQGVSFFFVLSGFILTYVYPTLGPGAWRPFLWARFARIWPGHVAAFLLVVLALPASASNNGWPHTFPTILANLSLVHGWIPWRKAFFSYNSPSWSVSTEAFFYLAFPFLIRRVERTWMVKLAVALLLVSGRRSLAPLRRHQQPRVRSADRRHGVRARPRVPGALASFAGAARGGAAVYLLHQPLVRVYALSGAPRIGIPNWLAYTLFWGVLLAGSHALWSLVERPSRTWLVRHGRAARPASGTPAPESLAQSRR